jgi:hypothetical protein
MSETQATLRDGRVLSATCEQIEVTSNLPRPDKHWTFTDAQGHEHFWSEGWPSLRWVVDQEDYVIIEDGYPEEYPGSGHYECILCGEEISPGMTGPSPFREFIPGMVSYYLDGEPITEEQYREIVAEQIASR